MKNIKDCIFWHGKRIQFLTPKEQVELNVANPTSAFHSLELHKKKHTIIY